MLHKKFFIDADIVLQGEGQLAGVPHLLLRTTGCNLKCPWCDTPYSSLKPERPTMSLEDALRILRQNPQIKNVMLTGGNPSIVKELPQICEVLSEWHITLEDNGTIYRENLKVDLVSLSPKLSNSIPEGRHRETHIKFIANWNAYEKWITNYNYQLKFVIQNELDILEALRIINYISADKSKVYFMPEGRTREELAQRRVWLAENCISLGVNYTDRLHIIIYGDKRGV